MGRARGRRPVAWKEHGGKSPSARITAGTRTWRHLLGRLLIAWAGPGLSEIDMAVGQEFYCGKFGPMMVLECQISHRRLALMSLSRIRR